LNKFYPELGNAALWCCTELTTRNSTDTALRLVADHDGSAPSAKEEAGVEEVAR
jgi:hypothetical protein